MEVAAGLGGVLHQPVLLDHVENRERSGAPDGVSHVGVAVNEVGPLGERLVDLVRDGDRTDREIKARNPLAGDHDIGDHAVVVHHEPTAGPAKPGHHFIRDQEDVVPVADLPNRGPVGLGRHQAVVLAGADRGREEGGDIVGPDVVDHLLELEGAGPAPVGLAHA